MDAEQLKAQTEGKRVERDLSIRQTSGGYLITGTTRYLHPDTGILALQLSYDAVAATTPDALEAGQKFLGTGEF